MGRAWSDEQDAELKRLWEVHGGGFRKIGAAMGRSLGSISGRSRVLGLQFRGGRSHILEASAPAARHAHTVFPARVIAPDQNVLKTGDNQRKLGKVVKKGAWRGFPIFSLTLEERATCPRSCEMWRQCYGNGMGHAKRYEFGAALERQISIELAFLQRRHPGGFVVRLHILGDFYSLPYVEFWRKALDYFPALHVFGYTARQTDTRIGAAIGHLRADRWDRFAVRTSGATSDSGVPRTLVFDGEPPPGAIVCPAQTGKTANCASCALCWSAAARHRPIAFAQH